MSLRPAALSRFPIRIRMPKLRRLLRGPINRPKTISLQAVLELSPINLQQPGGRPIIAANKLQRPAEVLAIYLFKGRPGDGHDRPGRAPLPARPMLHVPICLGR